MSSETVFLGLGSNLGDREAALLEARRLLGARGFVTERASRVYETAPVGGPVQPWYLNQVLLGATNLDPRGLLGVALGIEQVMGRLRGVANGPRPIDIDILLYGARLVSEPQLTIPHPRLHERRFVLVPLADLAPQVRHPVSGASIVELLDSCRDGSVVRPAGAVA